MDYFLFIKIVHAYYPSPQKIPSEEYKGENKDDLES